MFRRLSELRTILRSVIHPKRVEEELDEEFQYHLERQIEEEKNSGLDPEQARNAALRSMGAMDKSKEECRDIRGMRMISDVIRDIRYAVRILARSRGWTTVAILALALGVGANAAVFSVLDAVIFRPLPFEHPNRMVQVKDVLASGSVVAACGGNFQYYRDQNTVFERIAAAYGETAYRRGQDDHVERLRAIYLSSDYLLMTKTHAAIGRIFSPEEDRSGMPPVVMISHAYWQRAFGGRRDVLGRTLSLERWVGGGIGWEPYIPEIIGVLPPEFPAPVLGEARGLFDYGSRDLIFPVGARQRGCFGVLAELKKGTTIARAQAEMDTIALARTRDGIEPRFMETLKGYTIRLEPLDAMFTEEYGNALFPLWAATGLLLLIACAAVASLLFARSVVRQGEMAVRFSLGASRRRLIRQMLTENAVLGLSGGLLSILVAYLGIDLLRTRMPGSMLRLETSTLDLRVLGFLMAATTLTILLFGLAPALRNTRATVPGGDARPRTFGLHRLRPLRVLVVAQVAMSLILLVGSVLTVVTLRNVLGADIGIDNTDHLVLLGIQESPAQLVPPEARVNPRVLYQRIKQRLESLPEVVSVAGSAGQTLPLSGRQEESSVTMADRPAPPPGERVFVEWNSITIDYPETVGLRLLAGRLFTRDDLTRLDAIDSRAEPRPVLVNRKFADHFWPDRDPIGKTFYFGLQDPELVANTLAQSERHPQWDPAYPDPFPLKVVGVVGDVKELGLKYDAPLQYYVLRPRIPDNDALVIRIRTGPTDALIHTLEKEVRAAAPGQITGTLAGPMAHRVDNFTSEDRARALLVNLFAELAVFLTVLSLFGVLGYAVNQRRYEFGIRLAVGAQKRDISWLILGQAVRLTGLGILIGIPVSLWLNSRLSGILFGVSPTDPVVITASAVFLALLALVAAWLPARRAMRLKPMEVLRQE